MPDCAELRESLRPAAPAGVATSRGGSWSLQSAALAGGGSREEPMPRRLDERPVVDHQLVLGHPHRDVWPISRQGAA